MHVQLHYRSKKALLRKPSLAIPFRSTQVAMIYPSRSHDVLRMIDFTGFFLTCRPRETLGKGAPLIKP